MELQSRKELADTLQRRKTMALTTFKKHGTPVPTPVSVAVDGERIFFRTYAETWKAKRLRRNSFVEVTPSTFFGKRRGPTLPAQARLLADGEGAAARRALRRRHPFLQGMLVPLMHRLLRYTTLHYEIEPRPVRVRRARPHEAGRLREIARTAKGHWGYDSRLVEEWADGIDFETKMRERDLLVAEHDGAIVGWGAVAPPAAGVAWLEDLWVEPRFIGKRVGTLLFMALRQRAAELGATRLEWQADPNAAGFYERLGAKHLRDELSEWGRAVPLMGIGIGAR